MYVTDPCVSCGMRQRIPTLNLNLILNPKLDLISKLITVALLPTRPLACREYPHTDRKNMYQIMDLTAQNTLICPAVASIVEKIVNG